MIKPILLLGTMILSVNALAASVTDLNTALTKANTKSTRVASKIVYGGRDVIHPRIAGASQSIWDADQTQLG